MTRDPGSAPAGIWLRPLFLAVAVIAAILLGYGLAQSSRSNLGALSSLDWLWARARAYPTGASASPTTGAAECESYPELVRRLYAAREEQPGQALRLLESKRACYGPERRPLFSMLEGDLLALDGRHVESCGVLSSLGAKVHILRQADAAHARGDWPILILYLECLEQAAGKPGWVSPYRISELYFKLGEYQEQAGQPDDALASFTRSFQWYPVVWSAPAVRRAQLLAQLGRRVEAREFIQDALARSTDVLATVELMRELGVLWEAEHEIEFAYCAYRGAEKLAVALTPDWAADLARRIAALPRTQLPGDEECNRLTGQWLGAR